MQLTIQRWVSTLVIKVARRHSTGMHKLLSLIVSWDIIHFTNLARWLYCFSHYIIPQDPIHNAILLIAIGFLELFHQLTDFVTKMTFSPYIFNSIDSFQRILQFRNITFVHFFIFAMHFSRLHFFFELLIVILLAVFIWV
jgi:hypothetical protein